MRRFFKDYSLSIVLFALFALSWIGQSWTGWNHYRAEQQQTGATPTWFGPSGYVHEWGEATLENWQSEFLQLFTFVVLTAYLIHRGSHESKDTDDKMQAALDRIEDRLRSLEPPPGRQARAS
jgi:hypothetical protein